MDSVVVEKFIDLYKALLEQETSNHNTFITVLFGLVVIIVGITVYWNYVGAAREIKSEVDNKFDEEKEFIIEELKESLEELIDGKFKKYEEKLYETAGDVARSIALASREKGLHAIAIYWWSKYLARSLDRNHEETIRYVVDLIIGEIELLKKLEKKEKADLKEGEKYELHKIHHLEVVTKVINRIPAILDKEKNKIKKALKGRKSDKDDDKE